MPHILYRYLILEILPPFGVSLLGFTSIVFLGRMMKVTQMIVVKGVGLIDVLKTCVFSCPISWCSPSPWRPRWASCWP
jgi:lipopolysaccharide export system permease protein